MGADASADLRSSDVSNEDLARAQLYRLLAGLLSGPASAETLSRVARVEGDDTVLGKPLATLARVARASAPAAVADEYNAVFIGIGRGEVVPYGSYYLTGFLHEKPLAVLRDDLAALGIARAPGVSEPEDHVSALMETMAGLIDGAFGAPLSLAEQKRFFAKHIGNWAGHLFRDLEVAPSAVLYGAVGSVGRAFMSVEEAAYEYV